MANDEYLVTTPHIMPVGYLAEACAYFCFDQNFWSLSLDVKKTLEEKYRGLVDPIFVPGGAKDLASPASAEYREVAFGHLNTSIVKHRAKRVVCTTHRFCAAYGSIAECDGNPLARLEFHLAEHRKMEIAILQLFPQFQGKIEHFYLGLDGAVPLKI